MSRPTSTAPHAGQNGGAARTEAVVIGASAGAVEALSEILPRLPRGYGPPVIVVVHVPPNKESAIVELFQLKCALAIVEAEDKTPIRPGTVYFAPPNYHLLVEPDGRRLSLSGEEPVHYCRPAIDVLFETAADAYGAALVGVILTGANSDGAGGIRAVCDAGGTAIVQDPDTATVPTMPAAALARCPGASKLNLAEIAAYLQGAGQEPGQRHDQ